MYLSKWTFFILKKKKLKPFFVCGPNNLIQVRVLKYQGFLN